MLGTIDEVEAWMTREQIGLNREMPLNLVKIEEGHQRVMDVLQRVEYGTYQPGALNMNALWPLRKLHEGGVITDSSVIGGLSVREFEIPCPAVWPASFNSLTGTISPARKPNAKRFRP
jgi:hypothetical protein